MLKNYIKLVFKVILRKKYYTFLTLIGISFTIMIVTITAAFIDQVVGENKSEPNRNKTLLIKEVHLYKDGRILFGPAASLNFVNRYIKGLKTPEKISIYKDDTFVSDLNKTPRSHKLKYTDEVFWHITRFSFVEGKAFTKNEIKNASKVAVITEDLKKYYFDKEIAIGKSILINESNFKIIGVVKKAPLLGDASSDIWIPYTVDDTNNEDDFLGSYNIMLLANSKKDFNKIKREINTQLRKVKHPDPTIDSVRVTPLTALQHFAQIDKSDPDPSYGIMFSGIIISLFLFLIIPVISLVNLNISRISERSAEIGIRKSFGATSKALTVQFLVENIILTIIGGFFGLIFSIFIADALIMILNTLDPLYKISLGQIIISWRVFIFCFACCLFFGMLSGVYPAYKMSRLHPVQAIKGNIL